MTIRPQVKAFLDAAEILLSPTLLTSPLNEDECGMIKVCEETLEEKVLSHTLAYVS
jgi:hypothetical protein